MSIMLPEPAAITRVCHPISTQLWNLFLMELTNWRWSWRTALIVDTLGPLFFMVFIGVFARDSGTDALIYVLTGNIVMSLLLGTMSRVEARVSWLRFHGGLDFFATLPIPRYALILAMVGAFLVFSLPSITLVLTLGALWLQIPLHIHPLILVVIPLCTIPLAGLGALIALMIRDQSSGGNIAFLFTALLTAFGPILVPPDRLPPIILTLSGLSPTTYAASALRQTVAGPVTGQIIIDIIVLASVSVIALWFVNRKMAWRQG